MTGSGMQVRPGAEESPRQPMRGALFALALGGLVFGMAEYAGLAALSAIGSDLGIGDSGAGTVALAYSIGVVAGCPLLFWLGRFPLKGLLLALLLIGMAGCAATALASGPTFLLAARFLCGLPQGGWFGAAAAAAARCAPPRMAGAAVAASLQGMAAACVLGMPCCAWLAAHLSWRAAFLLTLALGLCALWALWRWLPAGNRAARDRGGLAFLGRAPNWIIFFAAAIGGGGLYCWLAYLNPLLLSTGWQQTDLAWLTLLLGLGMVCGNWLAGRLADLMSPALLTALIQGGMAALLAASFFLGQNWLPLLLLAGGAGFFAEAAPLQALALRFASGSPVAAEAAVQMAFYLGNALGAGLGALALTLGPRAPALAGCLLALAGCAALLALWRRGPGA